LPRDDNAAVLRQKYLELAAKYSAVVARLQQSLAQQANVFRLGLWALNISTSALAVVRADGVAMRNARWLQLDDVAAGAWIPEEGDPGTVYADLNRLALTEARRLPPGEPATASLRFRRARGEQIIEVRLERPETDKAVVLVIVRDITDEARARRELSETREALLQNEHLAVLGELASSVAHDLGNTLRGISARVSVLASNGGLGAAQAPIIAGLRESVEAAITSVRNLQDVARSGRLEPGPVELADVVRHAAEILQLRQPHDPPVVDVRRRLPKLPPVVGTISELTHLFITLFFNARDAMPEGGTIEVTGERARNRVRVVVADRGTGIPPEHLQHLFQPFFSTKGKAGTGLGLWLAKTAMRRFGGAITARNRRGGGAEFEINFQIASNGQVRPDRGRGRLRAPSAVSS
jgi:signal transduction histidine kinase